MRTSRKDLRERWVQERTEARAARQRDDVDEEWRHLERAHVLSQPMAGRHVRTHTAMMRLALRTRRPHEVVGQLFRTAVAAPGTWSGRYPQGNTGRANVSAFAEMDVPADLQGLLETVS